MHRHPSSHSNFAPLLMALASLGLILFAASGGRKSRSPEENTARQGNVEGLHSDPTSDPQSSDMESRGGGSGWPLGSTGQIEKPVESHPSTAGASPRKAPHEPAPSATEGAANSAVKGGPSTEPSSQKPTATVTSINSDDGAAAPNSVSTPSKSPGNTR